MNTKALRQKVLDLAIHGKLVPPAYRQAGKSLENIPAEKEGQWFVYVIECVDGSFYKGFTTDLIKRYKQHCAGIGAEWTKTHKPKQLFYWEIHYSEKSAIEREKYLKSGCGREWFKNEVVDKPENWESATVLLEKIRAEKAEKIKKGLPAGRRGELKADKKDSFIFTKECEFDEDKLGKCSSGTRHKRHYEQFADGTVKDIEDEIPFEVPDGWAWCRLGEISSELGDGIHGTPEYDVNGDYYFVNGNNLCNGKIIIKDDTKRVSQIEYNKYKKNLNQNTILVSINGTLGNIAFYNKENIILGKSACYFNLFEKQFKDFMFFLLSSEYFKKYASENATGSTIKNVSLKTMRDFLVPLPTLNEQKKIVSAIKTIFNQITIIENDKTDLQEIIKQTKSKILDLAIHGKLVPQDPIDEPAEELLKRIATSDNRPYKKIEEEEPYELPSNWSWCYLCDICSKIKRGKSPKYTDKSTIMAFAQKCNQKDGPTSLEKALYIDESSLKKYQEDEKMQFNDIVINSTGTGTLGRVGIFNCPIPDDVNAVYPDSHVTTVRILPEIDKLYCYYFIKNKQSYLETMGEGSTNQKELKPDTISSLYFPLPPYSEQLRIVSKIEELFSDLDSISSNLE